MGDFIYLTILSTRMSVYAKEGSGEDQVIARENRLRAFSTPDKVFNFFASYQFEAPGRFL